MSTPTPRSPRSRADFSRILNNAICADSLPKKLRGVDREAILLKHDADLRDLLHHAIICEESRTVLDVLCQPGNPQWKRHPCERCSAIIAALSEWLFCRERDHFADPAVQP